MDRSPWTDEDLERRSTAMLAPHSPAGLDRDTAMTVLAELQDLRLYLRRLWAIVDEVEGLLTPRRRVPSS